MSDTPRLSHKGDSPKPSKRPVRRRRIAAFGRRIELKVDREADERGHFAVSLFMDGEQRWLGVFVAPDDDDEPWEDEDPRHYAYRMGDQDV